jgi:hypothetical protein
MNTTSVLDELCQMLRASEKGFRTAERDVASPELKSAFREYSSQRGKLHAALQLLIHSLRSGITENKLTNDEIDSPVSEMADTDSLGKSGARRRDEHSILLQCERAEAATVAHYEKALRQPGNTDAAIDVLHAQYLKVRASHERIHALCAPMAADSGSSLVRVAA